MLGYCREQQLDYAGADAIYRQGEHHNKKWTLFTYLRGELFRRQGLFDAAVISYDEAIRRRATYPDSSNFPNPYVMLSAPHFRWLTQPLMPNIYSGRGLVREALGRFSEAARDLQFAVDRGKDDVPTWLALGRCYEQTGDHWRALLAFRAANERQPECVEALEGLRRVKATVVSHQDGATLVRLHFGASLDLI